MNEELLDQEVELVEESQEVEEQVEEQEEPQKETVPLHVLLEEKKKRKELEKKLRDFEEREIDTDILQEKNRIKQRYINKGYDEEIAELLAEDHADLKKEIKKLNSSKSQKDPLEDDIEDLAKDSFYSDAKAYSKEIKSKISEFSKKGIEISAEDAYNLVRNPKIKLKELRENEEQQELVARRDSTRSTIPNATTSSPKNPYPLDEVDKKALANLQRAQPNGGWTAEKYYKTRHNKK